MCLIIPKVIQEGDITQHIIMARFELGNRAIICLGYRYLQDTGGNTIFLTNHQVS